MKKARPESHITVYERNRADDTFGFGVVFSDATLGGFAEADPESYATITKRFAHWDDIDVHWRGEVVRSRGHGFAGLARSELLAILQARAAELGVELLFERELPGPEALPPADLVVIADGVHSALRSAFAADFQPTIDWRPNRFVWLGTTLPFEAFTFFFNESEHGLFQVHAYRYAEGRSTFIVECSEDTFFRAGLDKASEDETVAYCERVFAKELGGHRLLKNRSIWRQFPTIKNARWYSGNKVILGDAAHTAHFSIGSGTKLAMEDSIVLAEALCAHATVEEALVAYDRARRPAVEALQRSAQVSLEWFESTPRYGELDPLAFAFSLLTRSLRVTHENLAKRDPELVARIDRRFADKAATQSRVPAERRASPTPPMFTPLRLRELVLPNRVVLSPMCQYSAEDGLVDDWHLVHLGSRAVGGAGLVMTEMTDVSADGRITPGCAGMYRAEHVAAWRRVTSFVHKHSASKIGIQLAHAGRKGSTKRLWEGVDEPLDSGNWPLLAASAIPYKPGSATPKAMDRADMDQVRDDFVRATELAQEAGFDLVELHFAHGYLLSTFLSPFTNTRTDAYGGSLENRMRFPLEVLRAARAAWPADKPLLVRISATDWKPGGFSAADSVVLARALAANGCDLVDVSAGQVVTDAQPVYGRLFQVPFSDRIRQEAKVPTMTVGAITSYTDVNSILAAERADLCALARAHLFDPYWTRHAAHAAGYALPLPPQYVSIAGFRPRFE